MARRSSVALAAGFVGLGQALGEIGRRKAGRLDKAEEIYNQLIANPRLRVKSEFANRPFKRGDTAHFVRTMFEANPDFTRERGESAFLVEDEIRKLFPDDDAKTLEIRLGTAKILAQREGIRARTKTATARLAQQLLLKEWEQEFKTEQGRNRILENLLKYSLDDLKEFADPSGPFKSFFDKILQSVEFKTGPRWEGLRQKASQITGIGTPFTIEPTAVTPAQQEINSMRPEELEEMLRGYKEFKGAQTQKTAVPGVAGTPVEGQLEQRLQEQIPGQAPVQAPIQPAGTAVPPTGVPGEGVRGLPLPKAQPMDNLRALAFLRGATRRAA